jgi:thioredoxin reductase (NADPH)
MIRKVVIIGSGPSAMTAAIYAARADLKPLLFTGFLSGGVEGGQLMTTTDVENYPGFADGVQGPELVLQMREQAKKFGAEFISEDVVEIQSERYPFTVKSSKTSVQAFTVIIATGANAKRLDVPGTRDNEFWQKGVTACAICDGASPIFRNKPLLVMGGGDSACEEAVFLTKFASKVYLVHRRDEFRASKIMADRVKRHPNVEVVLNHVLNRVEGKELVSKAYVENVKTGQVSELDINGVFFAIGHTPNTSFVGSKIDLDEDGYICVQPNSTVTSVDGIFAAGDVVDKKYRQAVTAAGYGCMAALDAEKWLSHRAHTEKQKIGSKHS